MTPTLAEGSSLAETGRYFLRLGLIAFGGPAAHMAIMRRELVAQRRWLDDTQFADLIGAASLIPGPNSSELVMHIGGMRAGWRGLWLAGLAFILPAVLMVLGLAWLYVEHGDTPAGTGLLAGLQPVALALIVQAGWGLSGVVRSPLAAGAGLLALALALFTQLPEVLLIIGAGVVVVAVRVGPAVGRRVGALVPVVPLPGLGVLATGHTDASAWGLFGVFLKVGALLYGSGYVLAAVLEAELVDSRGWLTRPELVDAIAAGQVTPGPLFSSATFAGYLVDGVPGALAATAGIFLPSFVFVAMSRPLLPRLQRASWGRPFLDGVNAASLALIALAVFSLAEDVAATPFSASVFAVALAALVRLNPPSGWVIAAGALAGLAHEAWA